MDIGFLGSLRRSVTATLWPGGAAGIAAWWRPSLPWIAVSITVMLAGAILIVRFDIAQRREAFETDARIAHRLLSQRAGQHEAILATLVLLGPPVDRAEQPERRLPAFYPQVLSVSRRDRDAAWADPGDRAALDAAERESRAAKRSALGPIDTVAGQYTLVLAGDRASYALRLDVARMVPWDEWPFDRAGPVRAVLAYRDATIALHEGRSVDSAVFGLTPGFVSAKTLAVPGQPFELRLQRMTGPAQWPWMQLSVWCALVTIAAAAIAALRHSRRERRRAEELLRIGRTSRLGSLGEIAAGIAHELNQPLAATLANTMAARRLLDDDPPELVSAQQALAQAAAQARRAADVVKRLRRLVESPDGERVRQPIRLQEMVGKLLDLLEPELRARGIEVLRSGQSPAVLADPVALEQVLHNLVDNALHALDRVPEGARLLEITVSVHAGQGALTVRDTGPGIAPDVLVRVFEPFFSTRATGLGLGLSLSESLVQSMGGTLQAANSVPRGARFTITLPLAGEHA